MLPMLLVLLLMLLMLLMLLALRCMFVKLYHLHASTQARTRFAARAMLCEVPRQTTGYECCVRCC